MRERVRITLADGQPVFLDGLARSIRDWRPDLDVVAVAADGRRALRDIRRQQPDVALIERDLPSVSGLAILTAVRRDALGTRVVFLSACPDGDAVYEAIEMGAAGWLAKTARIHEIGDAIAAAHRGGIVLSPAMHAPFADEIATRRGEERPLTPREREILTLLARGRTVNRVAAELGTSRATVKTHLEHVFEKLGTTSQAGAVASAIRQQLIE